METYSSLHNHTDYSNLRLIDSINKVEDIIDHAFELGLKAVAITDHESLSGHNKAVEYYAKKYKDKDFKLLLGNEIYLATEGLTEETFQKGEPFYHTILIAKDAIGHRQLRELSSRAWTRGFFRNMMRVFNYPSDLFDIVGKEPGHLICSTACLGGYPGRNYQERPEKVDNFVNMLSGLFGRGMFYIEIQPSNNLDQIAFNQWAIERYWGKYPFIFTTDSHYLKAEDREVHKTFLNSKSSGDREIDEFYSFAYMMTIDEIAKLLKLPQDKFDEMARNTIRISDMCETYSLKKPQVVTKVKYEQIQDNRYVFDFVDYSTHPFLAAYKNSTNETDIYFFKLVANGWIRENVALDQRQRYIERLEEELGAIYEISEKIKLPLSDYFISMAKMIDIIWNEADSMVGPSRGSAGGFLINYLLGITQMDPLRQELYLPSWRFLHKDRPELPDIDIDTEAARRTKVFNKVQEYFKGIGGDLVNICTFGTEGTKSALRTASRGLGIDQDVISYLVSMIPNERGFDWTLDQCYTGDEEHKAMPKFKEEVDKYPELWTVAHKIEGLITRLGVHASGVVAVNGTFTEYNSFMKTSKEQIVSAYDLHDSESLGLVKYDFLTVSALDRIRQTFNYLLEDGRIKWQGNLKATYDKYLAPKILDGTSPEMWDMVSEGKISSLFQFDTIVGSQAIKLIKPRSLTELAIGNSVMRLMGDGELPLNIYARYKANIGEWYTEMAMNGLMKEDVAILEPHLLKLSGVADSQESVMMLVMDPKISNFAMSEANKLRKTIAKKDFREIDAVKELFYKKGTECGTNRRILDYIWNVQIAKQLGYSFSSIHTTGYSIMALQEMNLAYKYPIIYWNCACLSTDASANNEEDFYNLLDEGIVEISDDEDIRHSNKTDYAKIAIAIDRFSATTIITSPDINRSRLGFTPNVEDNSILYGLKGITRVTAPVIQEIMDHRPFTSLEDFINKVTKKIVTKDKIVNLIKAGAFDRLEGTNKAEVLRKFVMTTAELKKKITLQNANMLFDFELLPEQFAKEKKLYKLTKELRKNRDANKFYYILSDEVASKFDYNIPIKEMTFEGNDRVVSVIDSAKWDARYYDVAMARVKAYLVQHHDELLTALNDKLFNDEWVKYASGDELQWELDSMNMYHSGHPLKKIIQYIPVEVTPLDQVQENMIDGFFYIKEKQIPKMHLFSIAGTVLDRDTTKSIVTLQTVEGVISVKIYKDLFAFYNHVNTIKTHFGEEIDDSFFDKGTHLLVTGILRGDTFIPKVYRNSRIKPIMKIVLDDAGNFSSLDEKSASTINEG